MLSDDMYAIPTIFLEHNNRWHLEHIEKNMNINPIKHWTILNLFSIISDIKYGSCLSSILTSLLYFKVYKFIGLNVRKLPLLILKLANCFKIK